jgi:hypothetical protein
VPVLSATVCCWPKGGRRAPGSPRTRRRAQLRPSAAAASSRSAAHALRRAQQPKCRPNRRLWPQPDQPSPQSQSLSRSYGSVLPTSLTYISLTDQRLFTLETCCGYRVRPSTRVTLTHSDFQGPTEALRTPQEPQCSTHAARLSPGEPIPGARVLTKKRQLFPALRPTSPSSVASPLWPPRGRLVSVSRFGNINPIPFRGMVWVRDSVHERNHNHTPAFAVPLGPTDPCSTAVHMEPFSSLVLKGLT